MHPTLIISSMPVKITSWQNINTNIYHFAAQYGLGWVVSKNQIIYLKPTFLIETVVIDSVLLQLEATDLLVENEKCGMSARRN